MLTLMNDVVTASQADLGGDALWRTAGQLLARHPATQREARYSVSIRLDTYLICGVSPDTLRLDVV